MTFSEPVATPIVLAIVFPLLAVASVLSRFCSRRIRGAGFEYDDWMLIPALATALGNAVVTIIAACYGQLGKQVPLTPEGAPAVTDEYVVFQKSFLAHELLSTTSLGFTRFALLLLYGRVFAGGTQYFRWMLWSLYILNAMWTVTFFFVQLFNCYPVEDTWDFGSGTEERQCLTPGTFAHMHAWVISSVVLDALVLTLPWSMVPSLQLPKARKFAILGIFMLGAIVVGTAIGKIVAIFDVTSNLDSPGPIQYTEAPVFYWTMPETCIAIICACLPTMRPVLMKLGFASMFTSGHTTSARDKSQASNQWHSSGIHSSSNKHGSMRRTESFQNLARSGYRRSADSPDSTDVGDVELQSMGSAHATTSSGRKMEL